MAILVTSLATNPYSIGAPNPIPIVATLRAEHLVFTPTPPALPNTADRIDATWAPHPNNAMVQELTATQNAGGDTYYLPYDNNKISSMRLPSPPPAPVDFFLTANLSGCKVYIDTINGSNDLMVYHANARATGAPPDHSPINTQTPVAGAELDRLHQAAQADYTAAPYNLVLNNVASLATTSEGLWRKQGRPRRGRWLTLASGP